MQNSLPQHDLPHGWDSHGHPSGLPGHTAWKGWRKKQRQSLSPRWVPLYVLPLSFAPSLRNFMLNYSSMKHLHRVSYVVGTMTSTRQVTQLKVVLCAHLRGRHKVTYPGKKDKWQSHNIKKTTLEGVEHKWNWSLNPGRDWVYSLWSRRHSWNG